jgi:hypothetical protein
MQSAKNITGLELIKTSNSVARQEQNTSRWRDHERPLDSNLHWTSDASRLAEKSV